MFKAEMIRCWHPNSPGETVVVRRRFRKNREFATLSEVMKHCEWIMAIRYNHTRDVRPR